MSKDYKIKEDNQGGLFEDKEILQIITERLYGTSKKEV